MEDFTEPENYEGSNLLTIKRLAEKVQLKSEHDVNGTEQVGIEINAEKSRNRFYKSSPIIKDFISKSTLKPDQPGQPGKPGQPNRKRRRKKTVSTVLPISRLQSAASSTYKVTSNKTVHAKILFGLVSNAKNESIIKDLARSKFRWIIRMISIWTKYINYIVDRALRHQKKHLDALRSLKEIEDTFKLQKMDLNFNKHYFTASKNVELTQEDQKILTMSPSLRSDESVLQLVYRLNVLTEFDQYPLHLKKKLCRVSYFRKIEPNRVIVRQGHKAEYFYFIISGSALVTITTEGYIRTVNKLTKGCSFGELALLHHSVRTASVVSMTTMQLLAVSKKDFFTVFLNAINNSYHGLPDHISFLRNIPFLQHLDLELVNSTAEFCISQYYKNLTLVCENNMTSPWCYIVRSGTCTVIKEIKVPLDKDTLFLSRQNTMSLHDVKKRMMYYDNFCFVPTPLNLGTGNQKSETKYFWRERTKLQPGEFFCLIRNEQSVQDMLDNEDKQNAQDAYISVFLKLAELEAGDILGFSTLIFSHEDVLRTEDTSSVAMISNKADIIMISKKLLIQHANEHIIRDIRELPQYPSEKELLKNYETQCRWDEFKLKCYDSLIDRIYDIKL